MAEKVESTPVVDEMIVSKIHWIRGYKVMLDSEILRLQFATLRHGAHSKYLPYAFTEHGVLMLSNVLKSERAIQMSIKIIDVFVKLREMLLTHKDILLQLEKLENQVIENSEDIRMIFATLKQFLIPPEQSKRRWIGFRRPNQDE